MKKMINDVRNFYILYLLFDSDERHPIACSYLSEKLSLSNKTIHSNIEKMEEYCLENGFRILTKSANGFFCEIIDQKKADRLRQELSVYFSKNHVTYTDTSLEISNFVIYLVNRGTPISISELCDKFYVSKSKLYSYINESNIMLARTNLSLISNRDKGLSIEGEEYFKRLFIARCIGTSIFQYDIPFLFTDAFHYRPFTKDELSSVTGILRKYDLVLTDDAFNIMQFLLIYTEYRYSHSYTYTISEDYIRMSSFLNEFQAAREIMKTLKYSCVSSLSEIMNLASYLLTFNSRINEVSSARYGAFHYPRIMKLYDHMKAYMDELCNEFKTIDCYKTSLLQLACKIYFLKHYRCYETSISAVAYDLAITNNALVRYLSRGLCEAIDAYFDLKMSFQTAEYVVNFMSDLLNSAPLENSFINVLLVLKNGNIHYNYITSWINSHLNPKPFSIDLMSLYETNVLDTEKYDMILTDYDNIDHVVTRQKVYHIQEPLDSNCGFVNAYYSLSNMRNISLEQILQNFDYVFIHRDTKILSTKEFTEVLDNDLSDLGNIPIRFLRNNITPINYYAGHKTIIVPYIYKKKDAEKHKRILSIYFNQDNPKFKYEKLIFVSIYKDEGVISLIRLMNLFNALSVNKDIFERIERYVKIKK